MIKQIIYLGYYLKETDRKKFLKFLNYTSELTKKNKLLIVFDLIKSTYFYKISFLDYFYFRFYEKTVKERNEWAGTGYMYEFQLKMNPISTRKILEDKRVFLDLYKKFVKHNYAKLYQIKTGDSAFTNVIQNPTGKIVFKDALGQCGFGIQIDNAKNWYDHKVTTKYMESKGFNMIESFVQQADDLQKLSPTGLNTVRIFTQLTPNNEVVILGSRLRISVNSNVDNMASGNLAAVIDDSNGVVISNGVYSDITKENCSIHPITGVKILGFQVPFWNETISMVKEAALINISNRSIGWDVAVTNNGPELIEGNHNWCKLLWQLPVQKGLKNLIEEYNV